ncbi:MAG: phosphoenolpyruvate kinase [Planctomycetota bacterium]|nr:MAG: phosphoenolpyruvate kinase [Planctomycetota bacterium]
MTERYLDEEFLKQPFQHIALAQQAFLAKYPGPSLERQPVSTVYGGAHLFKSDLAAKLAKVARRFLQEYGDNFALFARAIRLPESRILPRRPEDIQSLLEEREKNPEAFRQNHPKAWHFYTLYQRVLEKLENEPVEDFRIDFEDGYGNRSDAEEDQAARNAAEELAKGWREKTLPPFIGIRIKPLNEELKIRSVRTLDIFLSRMLEKTEGTLPNHFVITLPKVVYADQVKIFVEILEKLENAHSLPEKSLRLELMIETPQAILSPEGHCHLPQLVQAAAGRCRGAHFGVYDYTALLGITANYQQMDHPVCDFARHMMQVALANTGIWLSDGATNIIPAPPHRQEELTSSQKKENRRSVHRAWRLAARHIRHSLRQGFYQGWDLHPAQLPVRYGVVFDFFLRNLAEASERLRNFIQKAAQATLVGDVFDDAATGQALLNYFLQGMNCGAISQQEALKTGLSLEEFRTRSFLKILENRGQK